jgi:hypothetical protein
MYLSMDIWIYGYMDIWRYTSTQQARSEGQGAMTRTLCVRWNSHSVPHGRTTTDTAATPYSQPVRSPHVSGVRESSAGVANRGALTLFASPRFCQCYQG